MVTQFYPPIIHGGGEISCKLLVDNLKKHINVEVITFGNSLSKSKILANIQAYRQIKKKIDDYDIFHTYNMTLTPCIGKITEKYNINSIATLNGIVFSPSLSTYNYKYLSPKFYRNKVLFRYIKNIKHFTTLFQVFKDDWIKDGLPSDKITVIPSMIDTNFKCIKSNSDRSTVNLLYVGNYSPTRGEEIRKVIESYSLLEKQQDISLTIVGKGKSQVINLINKYKPKNPIELLGEKSYSEMPKIYKDKDIFIHPSILPKTTDRVIYEAVLSGLCFITTGNNYYSTIFKTGKDGILLYPMTSKKLSENIQMLIDNKPLRKKLAIKGRQTVIRECSPEAITRKFLGVYNKMKRIN